MSLDVETSLDFQLLEQELLTQSCEHPDHLHAPAEHANGNEQYISITTPCGCWNGDIVVACWKWLTTCSLGLFPAQYYYCCGAYLPFDECVKILGPVGK